MQVWLKNTDTTRLRNLAAVSGRTQSDLAREAITSYLDRMEARGTIVNNVLVKFAVESKAVVAKARELAYKRVATKAGTEHLLVAVAATQDVSGVLLRYGVNLAHIESRMPREHGSEDSEEKPATTVAHSAEDLPFSRRLENTFQRARRISDERWDAAVLPQHLFVALLDGASGGAFHILQLIIGSDYGNLRTAVLKTVPKSSAAVSSENIARNKKQKLPDQKK